MDKIKVFSAMILVTSICICSMSACKKEIPEISTTTTTEHISTTESNGYTYNDIVFTMEHVSQYVHVVPPVPTQPKIEKNESGTSAAESTSHQNQSDKNEEISKGINILSKTSPVLKGNNASIIIIGTPGASYTVDFFETESKKAAYSGLEAVKADHSGVASWSFTIEESCESGERKVIIREQNSDKYIQTYITVY